MARYDQTPFRATHNSYSGGERGSIEEQLRGGVRVLELDVHARGFAELGDFRLGHLKPGAEVELGHGNPPSVRLSEWLALVARWSDQNVHAPVTLVLDSKDDLLSPDCGSPEDLNRTLLATLGGRLYTRAQRDADGAWPDTVDLRNRVLCVLSGNGNTRASYRWSLGTQPAVAINPRGDVVLVYRSTAGDLNAYLGALLPSGEIAWQHKSTYHFSRQPLSHPTVSLSDDGWVVAAHQFEPPPEFVGSRLESIVGRITDERRVSWFGPPQIYAQGGSPWLRIEGRELKAVHVATGGFSSLRGELDARRREVKWGRPRRAQTPPPPGDRATWNGATYRCLRDATGAILFGPEGAELTPVRFRQIAFVEQQQADADTSMRDALFFAADAKVQPALRAARQRGQVVRAWGFDQTDPPDLAQAAATDTPRAAWYRTLTDGFPA